eukprot:2326078-Alexandrium_andersonii.AAC.1
MRLPTNSATPAIEHHRIAYCVWYLRLYACERETFVVFRLAPMGRIRWLFGRGKTRSCPPSSAGSRRVA